MGDALVDSRVDVTKVGGGGAAVAQDAASVAAAIIPVVRV
jgi:hypothetical protein